MKTLAAALLAGLVSVAGCSSKDEKTSATGGSANGAGTGATQATGGKGGAQGGSSAGGGGSTSTGGNTSTGGTGDAGDAGATNGGSAGANATGGAGSGQGGSGTSGDGSGGSSGAGTGGAGAGGSAGAPTGTLDIYFVDTEGGQATVMKLPGGQVFIVDTGNPGARDGDRIQAVLRDELSRTSVDYLLTTHYDGDHVGGATYLNQRTPVANFLDHGDEGAPASYLAMANAGTRRVIEAGDTLDVGGVHFDFVSSNGELITTALPGGGGNNIACNGAVVRNESDENENSVGSVLRYGNFKFLNLGDLLWDWELRLACPVNLLGPIDLYLTTHHGLTRSGATPMVVGINAVAAVMNNGPRKGGGGQTWNALNSRPGGMNVWQLHQALASPASENAPADQIANLVEGSADMAFFLKVTVQASGAFTIENPRTGASRTYQSR